MDLKGYFMGKFLKYIYENSNSTLLFTGIPLLDENQKPIEIALVDAFTEQIVNTRTKSTAKLEITDFWVGDDDDSWTFEVFQERIMSETKRRLGGCCFDETGEWGIDRNIFPEEQTFCLISGKKILELKASSKIWGYIVRMHLRERDTLLREQNKRCDATTLLKEKDEIITQVMSKVKIARLENLMDGVLLEEEFLDEELRSLANKHEVCIPDSSS
ncbi:hypothetical protein L1987_34427 [Smallanthus sonchifolius]|uniref:Uncharacterized protein n=1 Tax=Smallanthus sonchifolius TaxID=185202 RepID=A0ACB9HWC8_9ASTR|nr:hypothetical protein L1987_34427 [Smallanthus sonchifolius]